MAYLYQEIMSVPGLSGSSYDRQKQLYEKLGSPKGAYTGSYDQNIWLLGQVPAAKSGGGQSQSSQPSNQGFDLEAEIRKQKEEEQRRKDEQERKAREGISSAFDPIFAELDRQLGTLPGERSTYETQVANLAGSQGTGVEAERTKGLQSLDRAKGEEEERAQSSLRDLEQDVRNQLRAKSSYFGNVGAGDSSAVGAASEAVTRAGLKARSKILSTRDQALGEIDQKIADVNTLASEQLRKVDEWKSTKLFEVGQFFSQRINELNMQKANASAEKGRAIAEIINGLEAQFVQRLRQLDDAVVNYKSSINTWQMQRAAEMEDYKTKLGLAAQYSGGSSNSAAMKLSNDVFNDSINQGFDAATARQRALQQTGIDPLGGLELTPEQMKDVKRRETEYPGYPVPTSPDVAPTQQPTLGSQLFDWASGLLGGNK